MAKRIQRERTKGWRMPEGAVYVGRPTVFGNPFQPVRQSDGSWLAVDDNGVDYPGYGPFRTRDGALRDCVRLFVELEIEYGFLGDRGGDIKTLRGHDLACWCPLDGPCHADVLLKIANR